MYSALERSAKFLGSSSLASRMVVGCAVVIAAGATFFVTTELHGAGSSASPANAASSSYPPTVAAQRLRRAPTAIVPTFGVAPARPAPLVQVAPSAPILRSPAPPMSAPVPPSALRGAPPLRGQAVAGTRWPPTIVANATQPHADRGACTWCHAVRTSAGAAIPVISPRATLPHAYRGGFCANCHRASGSSPQAEPGVRSGAAVAGGPPAAGTARRPDVVSRASARWGRWAGQNVRPTGAPTAANANKKGEGEWLGLEVAPLTPATRAQYKISPNTHGLVVAEVEAAAARTGFKAGDVVTSVNGLPTGDIAAFAHVTQWGKLGSGLVGIVRHGHHWRLWLPRKPQAPQAQSARPYVGATTPPPAPMAPPASVRPLAPSAAAPPAARNGQAPTQGGGARHF